MTGGPVAILVAAGAGERMGRDKLWIEILGRPIWRWSLDALLAVPALDRVVVVVPAPSLDRFSAALPSSSAGRCSLVPGEATRDGSVRAGLAAAADLADDTIVLVHDAARPAASAELFARVIAAGADAAAVAPGLPVRDSLKRASGPPDAPVAGEPVSRAGTMAVQTPQLARLGALRAALDAAAASGLEVTDEAGALVAAGVDVRIVPGEMGNLKLTDPGDEEILEAILRRRPEPAAGRPVGAGARAGVGIDAHRLEPGRPLRLGGLAFPDAERGLAGHSDGDVALHAVADALLGAAGLGDIGRLFPPDERWRGADSGELLRGAAERVAAAGWRPTSVDLSIVAEAPRIADHAGEMAGRIAGLIGLDAGAVSVKGTTSDGLGFAGAEGIAAIAVAVVTPDP